MRFPAFQFSVCSPQFSVHIFHPPEQWNDERENQQIKQYASNCNITPYCVTNERKLYMRLKAKVLNNSHTHTHTYTNNKPEKIAKSHCETKKLKLNFKHNTSAESFSSSLSVWIRSAQAQTHAQKGWKTEKSIHQTTFASVDAVLQCARVASLLFLMSHSLLSTERIGVFRLKKILCLFHYIFSHWMILLTVTLHNSFYSQFTCATCSMRQRCMNCEYLYTLVFSILFRILKNPPDAYLVPIQWKLQMTQTKFHRGMDGYLQ